MAIETFPEGQGMCVPDTRGCTPGTSQGCPEGQVCWPTEDGRGKCVAGMCLLGEEAGCPEGWVCWDTEETPPGLGTCLPDNTCTLPEGRECKPNEICWDTPSTPPGLGTCVPEGTCLLGDATTCAPDEVCWDTAQTPPGFGTCMPNNSCTLDGTWPCEPGYVCQDTLRMPPGMGTCVSEQVSPDPTIVSIELWQGSSLVPPLGEGSGWVGSGAGLVEIVTEGAGSGSGLVVKAGTAIAECDEAEQVSSIQRYIWRCRFEEGFAAPGPEVVVEVQLASHETKTQTYQVVLSPPAAEFTVTGSGVEPTEGLLGTAVLVCALPQDRTNAPADSLSMDNLVAKIDGTPITLEWEPYADLSNPLRKCQTARLPESLHSLGSLTVSADITVGDVAHNTATTPKSGSLTLTRVSIHELLNISGTVMPLMWTRNRLVIGTSNPSTNSGYVHFYTPSNRHLLRSVWNVGPMTGMAALGDSGLVAITNDNRVAVVGVDGQVDGSIISCLRNQSGISTTARFPYGLTMLAIGNATNEGNWRFAVPVEDGAQGRLLTYIPDGVSASDSCKLGAPLPGKMIAPVVGMDNAFEVMVINQNPLFGASNPSEPFAHVRLWGYEPTTSIWGDTGASTGAVHAIIANTLGVSASHVSSTTPPSWHFWIAAEWENTSTSGFEFSLMRGRMDQATTATLGGAHTSISPFALDADGRAYAVVKPVGSGTAYALHRYAADAINGAPPTLTATLAQAAPVGSPVLGQPISGVANETEAYVVTTDGTVYAFNADTLQLLWKQTFLDTSGQALHIAPTAQPVLHDNRLWLVSTDGELYALVVNSNGLSQSAQWPKMYHDNCNSNSRRAVRTSSSLSSCF